MALMTGGKAVVESLKAHGVDTIFGIISTHTMYIYDALYHEQDSIRFIGGRHEHALGFMADGYSRVTGKPGVLFTSGGPGAADSMGSMGEAYHASSMVLQVTANCELELIDSGKGAIHEAKDQLGMFRSVTGWNALIDNLDSLPDYFLEAFQRFSSGRPRPVELEVPTDLFEKQTDIEVLPPRETATLQPDPSKIEQAAQALKKAKRPVIWVGRGVMLANATAELRQLAETLQAPVTGATTGKGAFPDDHPLGLGVGEFGGIRGESPLGDFLNQSDLILLVGSSMAYHRTVQQGLKLPPNIIQIDIDPGEIGKNYPVSLGIVGDARMALEQMLSLIDANQVQPDPGYAKEISLLKDDIYQSLVTQYPNEATHPGRHSQRSGPRRCCRRRRHRSQLPRLPVHALLRAQHLPRPQLLGRPRIWLPGGPRSQSRRPRSAGRCDNRRRRVPVQHSGVGHGPPVRHKPSGPGLQR